MLAGVSVDDVIQVMNTDKGTGKKEIECALTHYGIAQSKTITITITKADNTIPLPDTCILKVLLSKYSHWGLYHKGKYYDPEFGLLDEVYCKARVQSYLEIFE